MSPVADGSQTAHEHAQLFENILDIYDKTKDMVDFLVGDNCNTNQSVANKLCVALAECASHRLNLAVSKYLAPHESLLSKVSDLMVELRHENNYAELKTHTELLPVKRNVTRWSSTITMVQRYTRIRAEIKKVVTVEELIPTGAKHRKILDLFEHMKKFESICPRLQRDETDIAEVRVMFDALVTDYSVMGELLKETAKIVLQPDFETAIMIPATSNIVERLFFQCKLVLTPQRRSMDTANFEELGFLRVSRDMWGVSTVADVTK
uniref:HAT C-terminal dimerisation domain-containing protein n=1 Tax=Phytophthora infestans TaxID=4787 RepID=Q572F8_PHYIN|nr:hypothetical protein, conserved [Phytophthora infestans]